MAALRRIFITGASSGLGAALAKAYAAGDVTLILCGRDQGRLEETAVECRRRGATTELCAFDLRDDRHLVQLIRDTDESGPIDLAIFNAGVGGVTPADELTETTERAEEIARVNFLSPVVGATLVGNLMAARKRGRIVLIGSVTESIPLPMAPAYAATKAGLAMFADSLEQSLSRHGVGVTIASLGYIDTPMSRSVHSIKPFMMSADDAAAIIKVRLTRGARRFVIPWQFAAIQTLHRLIPRALVRIIAQNV